MLAVQFTPLTFTLCMVLILFSGAFICLAFIPRKSKKEKQIEDDEQGNKWREYFQEKYKDAERPFYK